MRKIFNLISNPLFFGSAFIMIGSNITNLLNYIYHLLMGRMLGPVSYGELAAIISLLGLLGIIPASVSLVIIKYVSAAKSSEEINNLAGWLKAKVFKTSLFFSVTLMLLSPFISSFLHINKSIYVILAASTFLFSLQSLVNRSILQGLIMFKEMVITVIVENGVKLILSILLIYFGFRVGGAVFAMVVAALIGFLMTNLYLKYKTDASTKDSPRIKSMLTFTIPVLIQTASLASLYSSDVLLVKHFFSSHEAGIYAAISTLGKIIFFGAGPISTVMFPLVSKRQAGGQNYGKIFLLSFVATTLIAIAILSIYYMFPGIVIKTLYGSAYLEASNLLVWFGIFIAVFSLASLFTNFYLSLGRSKIVILPLLAAVSQIIIIWFWHQSLFSIILISTGVSTLLLIALSLYSILEWRLN